MGKAPHTQSQPPEGLGAPLEAPELGAVTFVLRFKARSQCATPPPSPQSRALLPSPSKTCRDFQLILSPLSLPPSLLVSLLPLPSACLLCCCLLRLPGSDDVSVARIAFQHGVCLRRSGRREEAERVLDECVKTLKARLGAGHEEVAAAKSMLDLCAATE